MSPGLPTGTGTFSRSVSFGPALAILLVSELALLLSTDAAALIAATGRLATSRKVDGKYPIRPSLDRHLHQSLGLPSGSVLLSTATRSPFLTSKSTPWTTASPRDSGEKSHSTRQNSSFAGSIGWAWSCLLRSSSSCDAAMDRIILVMRYGSPNANRRKNISGFRLGLEGPAPPPGALSACRPSNLAKDAGVRAIASAGGGRPVTLAISERIQRIMV